MNKNLPIEILNKILIMRPTHPIAKLFEEDYNVILWNKHYTSKWFFSEFYFVNTYNISKNKSCRVYDEIFFIKYVYGRKLW